MIRNAIAVLALALACCCWTGCGRKEDKLGPKCLRGELNLIPEIAAKLGVSGVPQRFDCPSRLSTSGPAPPDEAWEGGVSAFWGPELVAVLNKDKTGALRDKGETACIYAWSQGCADTSASP